MTISVPLGGVSTNCCNGWFGNVIAREQGMWRDLEPTERHPDAVRSAGTHLADCEDRSRENRRAKTGKRHGSPKKLQRDECIAQPARVAEIAEIAEIAGFALCMGMVSLHVNEARSISVEEISNCWK